MFIFSVFLKWFVPSLIIQTFDTNQINNRVILLVCQLDLMVAKLCMCIIYCSRQISYLRGVLEANNATDSQKLNVGRNLRHTL